MGRCRRTLCSVVRERSMSVHRWHCVSQAWPRWRRRGCRAPMAFEEAQLAILASLGEALHSTSVAQMLEVLLQQWLDAMGLPRSSAFVLEPDGRLAPWAHPG